MEPGRLVVTAELTARKLTPLPPNSPLRRRRRRRRPGPSGCLTAGPPANLKHGHFGAVLCRDCRRAVYLPRDARVTPPPVVHRSSCCIGEFLRGGGRAGRGRGRRSVVCLLQINCRRFRPGVPPGAASIRCRSVGDCRPQQAATAGGRSRRQQAATAGHNRRQQAATAGHNRRQQAATAGHNRRQQAATAGHNRREHQAATKGDTSRQN